MSADAAARAARRPAAVVPRDVDAVVVRLDGRDVQLTNLRKPFWPALGLSKGDLLRYYVAVAPALLPHLRDRPMVMRRYPDGAAGKSFFMKQTPATRPSWLEVCPVRHSSGKTIEFALVQDLASLLWVVNLGCIDLNPWYGRRDDVDRPDALWLDLDPGPRAPFARMLETAMVVRDALDVLAMPSVVKTTGSRGIHVAVPIVRGPLQRQVWEVARALAVELARRNPTLVTVEYAKVRRPADRVLLDYNQNAWGQTLASVYSVRPSPQAAVSTPVTWAEVARGFAPADFRIDNVPARVRRRGDLFAPLLAARGRFRLDRLTT